VAERPSVRHPTPADLSVGSYWAKAIVAAGMFLASVILRELGHSLVAHRHGVSFASTTLFVFAGVSEMRDEPRVARREFEIAIIGPAGVPPAHHGASSSARC
jgi:Zn-dependent protease